MADPEGYKVVARLLREEASCSRIAPHQAADAIRLAEYFEKLAANPCIDITDPQFIEQDQMASASFRQV